MDHKPFRPNFTGSALLAFLLVWVALAMIAMHAPRKAVWGVMLADMFLVGRVSTISKYDRMRY